jgi:hypothetical protein
MKTFLLIIGVWAFIAWVVYTARKNNRRYRRKIPAKHFSPYLSNVTGKYKKKTPIQSGKKSTVMMQQKKHNELGKHFFDGK